MVQGLLFCYNGYFSYFPPVLDNIEGSYTTEYKDIFSSLAEQSRVMNVFLKIEQKRIHTKTYHLLPGEKKCQDPCTFGVILSGAADASAYLQCICSGL